MSAGRRIALVCTGLAGLAAFVVLAFAVTRVPGVVPGPDRVWHDDLRTYGMDHPIWLSTWNAVTQIGATITVVAVDAALVAACLVRGRRGLAAFVAVVGLGGWGLRILLRDEIGRPRATDSLWSADGASFPSGHTTNGTLMALMAAIVCWHLVESAVARWAVTATAGVAALAVGFSRVAGGVHWPTDVLGGWILAVAWLCLVAAAFPWARGAPPSPGVPAGPSPARPNARHFRGMST